MKRFISLIALLLVILTAFSQTDVPVTKFLGIPIDGYKSDMIQKLKAKGYTYDANKDCLFGEFNGRNVNIHIVTNNNKVYRIMVADANYVSASDIKIRFNNLCQQFEKNVKYIKTTFLSDYDLSDEEDISYEIAANDKRYEASYCQITQVLDTTTLKVEFTEYYTRNHDLLKDLIETIEEEEVKAYVLLKLYINEKFSKNSVWFMIDEKYGKYGILLYYDNKRNQANGEDL